LAEVVEVVTWFGRGYTLVNVRNRKTAAFIEMTQFAEMAWQTLRSL